MTISNLENAFLFNAGANVNRRPAIQRTGLLFSFVSGRLTQRLDPTPLPHIPDSFKNQLIDYKAVSTRHPLLNSKQRHRFSATFSHFLGVFGAELGQFNRKAL